MRRLVVNLDDELADLLAKFPNQNDVVRKALHLYLSDITTDTLQSIKTSYTIIVKAIKELDSKVDFIARKVQ